MYIYSFDGTNVKHDGIDEHQTYPRRLAVENPHIIYFFAEAGSA